MCLVNLNHPLVKYGLTKSKYFICTLKFKKVSQKTIFFLKTITTGDIIINSFILLHGGICEKKRTNNNQQRMQTYIYISTIIKIVYNRKFRSYQISFNYLAAKLISILDYICIKILYSKYAVL